MKEKNIVQEIARKDINNMQLYTVFLDYKGGTYILQVSVSIDSTLEQVGNEWLRLVEKDGVLESEELSDIAADIREYGFAKLNDATNVFCMSSSIKNELALINVVKTSNE